MIMVYRFGCRLLLVFFLLFISCKSREKKEPEYSLEYAGEVRDVMAGDLRAVISFDSLQNKTSLYALGVEENLKGEIQVFNGECLVSRLENDSIQVSNTFQVKAAMATYAQVSSWVSRLLPLSVTGSESLAGYLEYNAEEMGTDVNTPFMFRIEGGVKELAWHVVDWDQEEGEHTAENHDKSGLKGSLENQQVEIIGIYAPESHRGILTHHMTPLHMHFRNQDNSLAGHVEELAIGEEMTLHLPISSK